MPRTPAALPAPRALTPLSPLLLDAQGMACVGRTKECTIVPSNHYGPIPGIPVGTMWRFRVQVPPPPRLWGSADGFCALTGRWARATPRAGARAGLQARRGGWGPGSHRGEDALGRRARPLALRVGGSEGCGSGVSTAARPRDGVHVLLVFAGQ